MIEDDMVQQVILAAEKAKAAGFLKTYDAMLAVATEIINDAYDVSGEDHPRWMCQNSLATNSAQPK